MPTNKRLTIAGVGGIRPYLNALAEMNGSDQDYAWFDMQCSLVEAKQKSKREVYDEMGISQATFEKYLTLRKIERVQQNGN